MKRRILISALIRLALCLSLAAIIGGIPFIAIQFSDACFDEQNKQLLSMINDGVYVYGFLITVIFVSESVLFYFKKDDNNRRN